MSDHQRDAGDGEHMTALKSHDRLAQDVSEKRPPSTAAECLTDRLLVRGSAEGFLQIDVYLETTRCNEMG